MTTKKRKPETLWVRDERHQEALYKAARAGEMFMHGGAGEGYHRVLRAAVYSVIPGKQRKRAYMDQVLETAVRAACRALRRKAQSR